MLSLVNLEVAGVFLVVSVLAYLVYNLKRKYEFWKDRNVPQVGLSKDFFLNLLKHRLCNLQDIYDDFAGIPYGGYYQGGTPYLMIKDPELIRRIMIKDFSHFTDHGMLMVMNDPIQRDNLFNLTGQRWKSIRSKISPIFTSGKLRRMTILMNECTKLLDKYLERTTGKSDEIEVRELFQKFAVDTIGICAFGINCNAIEDKDSYFNRIVRKLSAPGTFFRGLCMLLLNAVSPKILAAFKLKIMDPDIENFFYSLVSSTIQNREEEKVKRDDFMQLLINVRAEEQKMLQEEKDGSEPLFDDDVCMANAFIFFGAGFDPVSTTLSHCLYDLALNPEVMEKLYLEVKRVRDAHDGKIDYDILKEMEYLHCVISETLRLHPPAGWLERICTKAYQIPDSSLTLAENSHISIPVACLHRDAQFFPDPEKFDPDRFSVNNKNNIVPGSYIPFGDGPRLCIAERFALMEMKAAMALIVSKYTVHPCARTQIPLKLNPLSFSNTPKAIYLKICRRQ